jgi:hypothetical protein
MKIAISRDPIPENHISLSNAFFLVLDRVEQTKKADIQKRLGRWNKTLDRQSSEDRREDGSTPSEILLRHCDRAANIILREALQAGDLQARVRDPKNDRILQVGQYDWIPDSMASLTPSVPACGLLTNYVGPAGKLGSLTCDFGPPETVIRGKLRPVFFADGDFRTWLEKQFPGSFRKGRPKGAGSLAPADEALIREMNELIATHRAASPNEAARIVSSKASGKGSPDSIQARLRKRYKQRYR